MCEQVEDLTLLFAFGGKELDSSHGADEFFVDEELARLPFLNDFDPDGAGAVDGPLEVCGGLFL